MNANEASELARKVNIESHDSQYSKVQEIIKKAASKGFYVAYYYDPLRGDVFDKLKEEGFNTTTYSDQREGTTVTITWSPNKSSSNDLGLTERTGFPM